MEPYEQSIEVVLQSIKSNKGKGLTEKEAQERLKKYGKNTLKEKKRTNPLIIFLNQFRSFIIYILLFAVGVAFISDEKVDALIIFIILVFNALFGFIQEFKAEKAIEALKKLTNHAAIVIRDGKTRKVPAEELVPGDIVLLQEGAKIAADARIIEAQGLQVAEASLTGESIPVTKTDQTLKEKRVLAERTNMVFSGTLVTRGKAKVIVLGTGMQTELGKIANLMNETEDDETPLQKRLSKLGKWIGFITLAICALIFIVGIIKTNLYTLLFNGHFAAFIIGAKTWLLTAVSLAVAAVPEGLPAVVTVSLALGVRRMIKKNALMRHLPSIETLGETTIICSDKTGTLTKNEMTVRAAFAGGVELTIKGEGYSVTKGKKEIEGKITKDHEALLTCGMMCNDAQIMKEKIIGDPTEAALLISAEKAGKRDERTAWKRIDEIPFDANRKMMSVLCKKGKETVQFTKGAPEKILDKCKTYLQNGTVKKLTAEKRKELLKKNSEYAAKALRVLACATSIATKSKSKEEKSKINEENLTFIGFQAMIDPPHPQVKDAIKTCYAAGMQVMMITGDNINTAKAIAEEIGIKGKAIEGSEFANAPKTKQNKILQSHAIFARVEPQHKLLIVDLLQKKGHVVAMTGDGVNDAPALKKADIGIAMGITGTDVAKEASEMILQDDNFTSIVGAVSEGRAVLGNIRNFVNYLLSTNIAEVAIIFFALVLSMPLPLTAIMLLWINLVTDGFPALALSVDPPPKNIMERGPQKAQEGILGKSALMRFAVFAIIVTAAVLLIFSWSIRQYAGLDNGVERAQTIAFTSLFILEIVRLHFIRKQAGLSITSNKYLIAAVLFSAILHLVIIYSPLQMFFGTTSLNIKDWMTILGTGGGIAVFGMIVLQLKELKKVKSMPRLSSR